MNTCFYVRPVWAVLICFLLTGSYQFVVAKAYGLVYMCPMDAVAFTSPKESNINFMSISAFDGECLNKEYFKNIVYRKFFAGVFEKFQYQVVSKFGDLYYKRMDIDWAMERGFEFIDGIGFKNNYELDCYVRDNLNKKMPLDGPQWRCLATRMTDDEGKTYFI